MNKGYFEAEVSSSAVNNFDHCFNLQKTQRQFAGPLLLPSLPKMVPLG